MTLGQGLLPSPSSPRTVTCRVWFRAVMVTFGPCCALLAFPRFLATEFGRMFSTCWYTFEALSDRLIAAGETPPPFGLVAVAVGGTKIAQWVEYGGVECGRLFSLLVCFPVFVQSFDFDHRFRS